MIDLSKSNKLFCTDKCTYSASVRLITGFNGLNYCNNLLQPQDFPDSTCRYCHYLTETSEHIISDCPAFWQERADCFNTFNEVDLSQVKPKELHSFVQTKRFTLLENMSEYKLLFFSDYDKISDTTNSSFFSVNPGSDTSPRSVRSGIG